MRKSPEEIARGLDMAAEIVKVTEEFVLSNGGKVGPRGCGAAFLSELAQEFRSGRITFRVEA